MNEIISTISSLITLLNGLSTIVNRFPRTFIPPTGKKIQRVQDDINSIKHEVLLLQGSLERNKNLTIAYSDVLIDVSIAYALANKLSELFKHVPVFCEISSTFISEAKQDLNSVEYKLKNLPAVDSTEFGRLQSQVEQLKRTMNEVCNCDSSKSEDLSIGFTKLADDYNSLKLELRGYFDRIIGKSQR